jgi:NADP-dependent 3-hydroxy acid dehydrogenase YdfG
MKPLVAITGASSGIGEATAKMFSEAGYPLLLMARRLERMTALGLPDAICKRVDVTHVDQIHSALEEAQKKYGPVDCMINNAGIGYLGEPWNQPLKDWDDMVEVNINGVLNGIHEVLPEMVERQHGTIINISSLAGKRTFAKHAVYCGTKFAVHAITETIHDEVAKFNVRVLVISPATAATEVITHTRSKQLQEEWWKAFEKPLKAEDVARVIKFAYEQPQEVSVREIVVTPTR